MTEKGMRNTVVGGKYILGQMIGKGSFGQVYLATVEGDNALYAVKREEQSSKHQQLGHQCKILKNYDKIVGFPRVYWAGHQNKSMYLAMQLLGPSLEDLFCLCDKQFTLKTVLMLADQMLLRIEQFHARNYIHRDLKPQNFLMGLEDNSHIVYLVDYGLSRRYRDPKTHQHIPYKENKNLTGTVRYSSINTHFGCEQSRRDDLQSIGFILMYLLRGSLPWQGIKANNKTEKYQKIQEKKLSTPIEQQCKGLPIEFATYLNYCRTLKFQEKPDYKFVRKLFRDLFDRIGFTMDFKYDWTILKARRQLQTNQLVMIIEKQGDEIAPLSNQKGQEGQQLRESEIKVAILRDSGSQNVPEDSINETELEFMERRGSEHRFKMLQCKNIDKW